ncbi:MAG: GLPGLI family protein [Bacteroidia bacterium]|nr:GLPGLI family protein [Bacteroidia bacterium]
MFKKSLLITICFIPLICSSQQVLDNAHLKCHYQYLWQNDTLTGKTRDDLIVLQIGQNLSKSYSYYSNQVDSISALPNGDKIAGKMIDNAMKNGDFMKGNYLHKRMKAYIYKNHPQGKITVTDGLSLQDYIYEDELNAQNWQFADSMKTILNYPCQMAVCDFRGRQWTAWFAPDIPISDGPWKFNGLPGLIMEVYDHDSQYHFTAIGLQKVENEPIIFSETYVGSKKFEKTNRIDFLKAKKRYLMDMNGYIQMETGIDLSGGQPEKIMRYDLMELDYK